ncbi:MAG: phenylalanine--tRNA ligase subunit beta [Candidatus Nanohaloarchaea archaeon]
MAHVEIDRREFEELLGRSVSEQELRENASDLGVHWTHVEGPKWDVEVYPNRPDLLSVEGLARAYRGFFDVYTGREEYEAEPGDLELSVDGSVDQVRPFIGAAVVRGLELTEKKINGLIQLQEKLHETIGRRRDKIAIGLHDMSELEPPFEYRAADPESVRFRPLEHEKILRLDEILANHDKGREYAWILEDETEYPVIVDSENQVLSFPPIINNQLTEVDEVTSDVFVDVTGKDRQTVNRVLNILATALAERGGTVESVDVAGEEMPGLDPYVRELDPEYLRDVSGLELEDEEILHKLREMKHGAEMSEDGILVEVPCYRNDVMHQYDLIEDAVIAHRYSNIEPGIPEIDQIGERKPLGRFQDVLRDSLQGAGAMEAHTYILSSEEKLFDRMERERSEVASMSNALTEDYSVVRSSLLPSLMEALRDNRHRQYPQQFFEVAEVVELDDSQTGASNRPRIAYVTCGPSINYNSARKMLQVLERDLGIELEVRESDEEGMRPERSAQILDQQEGRIGILGEFRSQVSENWGIEHPIAGFELYVEKLMDIRGR